MKTPPPNILSSETALKGSQGALGTLKGTGIGLKAQHYQEILATSPDLDWFEVHAENYMGEGGAPHFYLTQITERYPLSIHGVGLSIGGQDPLDKDHLQRLKTLNDRYRPALFSEHLAWSSHGDQFYNDLLPLPYIASTLKTVCAHIDQLQQVLGRQILLENPSTYIAYADNSFSEPDFLARIVEHTGCGLLLDINNIYVSAHNNNFNPVEFINTFPLAAVQEIHLAGHEREIIQVEENGGEGTGKQQSLLIDDHGSPVCFDVWQLYQYALARAEMIKAPKGEAGCIPTLIERDNNIPSLSGLVAEARKAADIMCDAKETYATRS